MAMVLRYVNYYLSFDKYDMRTGTFRPARPSLGAGPLLGTIEQNQAIGCTYAESVHSNRRINRETIRQSPSAKYNQRATETRSEPTRGHHHARSCCVFRRMRVRRANP